MTYLFYWLCGLGYQGTEASLPTVKELAQRLSNSTEEISREASYLEVSVVPSSQGRWTLTLSQQTFRKKNRRLQMKEIREIPLAAIARILLHHDPEGLADGERAYSLIVQYKLAGDGSPVYQYQGEARQNFGQWQSVSIGTYTRELAESLKAQMLQLRDQARVDLLQQ